MFPLSNGRVDIEVGEMPSRANYSAIASPLNEATSVKDKNGEPINVGSEKVNLELDEKGKAEFEKLKGCLTTTAAENQEARVLTMPNFAREFILYMDACDEGLGAVLCQENDEKKIRPVAFYSKKLKASDR